MDRVTIVKILCETRPRTALCRRVGISPQYASGISRGRPIGGAETLARFAGRLLIPTQGREAAAEVVLATLEHDFPEHFAAHEPAPEAAETAAE